MPLQFQSKVFVVAALSLLAVCLSGCFAPLRSPGIPACQLPEHFRMPARTAGPHLNFSQLTIQQPTDYLVGPNDVLSVSIPELNEGAAIQIISVTVMSDGTIHLPMLGPINVGGLNLVAAQTKVNDGFASGVLNEPNVTVALETKATIGVLVLGSVNQPGVHYLPRFENDVGHAIAAAGGTTTDAAEEIEVHRKSGALNVPATIDQPHKKTQLNNTSFEGRYPIQGQGNVESRSTDFLGSTLDGMFSSATVDDSYPTTQYSSFQESNGKSGTIQTLSPIIERIPMRGLGAANITEDKITLMPGDVVVVPDRKHEVFFVVGRLNPINTVRFTVGDRERELGVGFILPRDREIDVVTAVAMAGYIDPIESPTTVTVHRTNPDGTPMLINVDLIAARSDRQETILVNPGDIIYLNPDASWWFRKTLDRIVPSLIVEPFLKSIGR